jgi:hypothetical protein
MKYRIHTFKRGWYKKTDVVEGKSHIDALRKTLTTGAYPPNYYHFVVCGTTYRRYSNKMQPIKGQILIHTFSRSYAPTEYCLLLLIGNVAEIYRTVTKSKREKLCTDLESARTANPDAPLNAITACLEGANVFPYTSTSKKTSKMYVERAITLADLTLMHTAKASGKSSVKNTVSGTWKRGSKASPSKRGVILATINLKDADPTEHPTFNKFMKEMDGHTIEVSKTPSTGNYYGASHYWNPKWLIFEKKSNKPAEWHPQDEMFATVIVKRSKSVTSGGHYDVTNAPMLSFYGKTLLFTKTSDEGWWMSGGWHWHESWLDFKSLELYAKMGTHPKISFNENMKKYVGRKIKLTTYWHEHIGEYVYKGPGDWCWVKGWLSTTSSVTDFKYGGDFPILNPIITTGGS